jgi:hypothetical protein
MNLDQFTHVVQRLVGDFEEFVKHLAEIKDDEAYPETQAEDLWFEDLGDFFQADPHRRRGKVQAP